MKKLVLFICATTLIATSSNAQNAPTNNGLETWQVKPLTFTPPTPIEIPTSWSTIDSLLNSLYYFYTQIPMSQQTVFKSTTIKNSGNSSAKIVMSSMPGINPLSGLLTNGNVIFDPLQSSILITGGTPISQRIAKASAYIKNDADIADSAVFTVIILSTSTGVESVIGSGEVVLGTVPNFTKIDVPITYINTTLPANLIRYNFMNSVSSSLTTSTMYVDDVTYTTTTGITEALMNDIKITAFPNPVNDVLTINASSEDELVFELYAIDGKVMQTKTFSKATQINVAELASGLYLYTVKNNDHAIIKKATINIAH
jgi:hypothetical protein